jgi:hypothetical protein
VITIHDNRDQEDADAASRAGSRTPSIFESILNLGK